MKKIQQKYHNHKYENYNHSHNHYESNSYNTKPNVKIQQNAATGNNHNTASKTYNHNLQLTTNPTPYNT